MDEILSNYAELDLRNLYEINTQYENENMNPFNLADINSNYYDVNDILPDKFSHNNFQCKVLHLNIQGLSSKFDQLQTLLSDLIMRIFSSCPIITLFIKIERLKLKVVSRYISVVIFSII